MFQHVVGSCQNASEDSCEKNLDDLFVDKIFLKFWKFKKFRKIFSSSEVKSLQNKKKNIFHVFLTAIKVFFNQ